MKRLWKIWRGSRFLGNVTAESAEKAVEAYSEWSSIPEHELRAEATR